MYSADVPAMEELCQNEITDILWRNKESITGIHFLGGEPLLRPDLMEIIAACSKLGIETVVTTNGVMLDEVAGEEILRTGARGLNVSLNGATQGTHDLIQGASCFERVTRNIRTLVAKRRQLAKGDFHIGVTFVLSKPSLAEGPALVDLCHDLGVDQLNISNLLLAGSASKNSTSIAVCPEERLAFIESVVRWLRLNSGFCVSLDGFPSQWQYLRTKYGFRQPANKTCYAGLKHMYVRADGAAFPCFLCAVLPELHDLAVSNQLFTPETLNLRTRTVAAIRDSQYFRTFARFAHHPKSYDRLITCKACEFKRDCRPCPLMVIGKDQVDDCVLVSERMNIEMGKALTQSQDNLRLQ